MKEAFEKAGVNTASARLAKLAYEVLHRAKRKPAVALEGFADQVLADPALVMELLKPVRADVLRIGLPYLRARANDMAGVKGGASQASSDSHMVDDRPTTPSNGTSQSERDGLEKIDRPGGLGASGASLTGNESQRLFYRPARAKAARAKIPGAIAQKVMAHGIMARPIGTGRRPLHQVTWGEVEHLYQLRAKDALETTEEVVMLNVLRRWVPEDQMALVSEIGADARLDDVAREVETAVKKWEGIRGMMSQRPVGDLEALLVNATSE